jgi:hypothetical protein
MIKKINYLDVTAIIRPARIALIVNFDEITPGYLTEVLIPFAFSHWGGANYFIFPYRNDYNVNANSSKMWAELLQKYDPDTIVSTTNTTQLFQKFLLSNVITNQLFEHSPHVSRPNVGHRGSHASTKLENVIESTHKKLDIIWITPRHVTHY